MRHFRLESILLYLHRISVFTQNLGQTQILLLFQSLKCDFIGNTTLNRITDMSAEQSALMSVIFYLLFFAFFVLFLPFFSFVGCGESVPSAFCRFNSASSAFISTISTLSFSSHSSRVWA